MPTTLNPMACACFNTRRSSRTLAQRYDKALAEAGVTNAQFSLLAIANARDALSITELADAMDVERTTLTRNLRVLQNRGDLALKSGQDRRTKHVVLTAQGTRTLRRAQPYWERAQQEVISAFGARRWSALKRELDALRDAAKS